MSQFIESKTHNGGAGTGEEIKWLGGSLGRCRTKEDKKPAVNATKANRIVGTCVKWDGSRGFGFLRPLDGSADIFVHAADLARSGIERLTYGERLSFEVVEGKGGKPAAINIEEL